MTEQIKAEVEAFKNYLQAQGFSRKSIKSRAQVLNRYLTWTAQEALAAEGIDYRDLLAFMKYSQQKGKSQSTIQHEMIVIRHYYDQLISEGKIATNPTARINIKGIRRKSLYHILKPHELHQLYYKYTATNLSEKRNKVMLGLLVYQGVQTIELRQLETSHVQLREGKIRIPGGPNRNEREMQLEPYQVMDMYDYTLQVRPLILGMEPKRNAQIKQETQQLFIGREGSHNINNFMSSILTRLKQINPQVKNARQIRASVITKWLRQHNLREAQYMAGHKYVSSTESYQQNDLEGLQEEIGKYHPLG